MKKLILMAFGISAFALQAQQSFTGLRTSPYGGVYNVTTNPASIVDGMKKWHVNLVSFDANISNNKVGLTTSFKDEFNKFAQTSVTYDDINVDLNVDVLGPSFMFHIGEKNAIAIHSRMRILGDIHQIDAKVFDALISSAKNNNIPQIVKIDNQHISANAFSEVGATYSRLIFKSDNHALKAGVTMKRVSGAISSYAGFNNFSGKVTLEGSNDKAILNIEGTGDFILNNGGVDITEKVNPSDFLKGSTSAIGFDLGLVYEYRFEPCPTCSRIPYDFKIGASITDIGKLKYNVNDGYRYRFNTGSTAIKVDLNNMKESLDKINESILVKESIKGQQITSSLPTAFRLYADARVWGMLSVDFEGVFSMVNKSEAYNSSYSNAFMITPRVEGRALGVYLPISNISNVGTSVGAALRLGPLVVGSNTILGNVFSKNTKALNVFFGLQFGK